MSDSKDKSDEITTSENSYSPPDSNLDQSPALPDNPHSMPKQLTGIVISSVIIIIVTFPYLVIGVLLAVTGISLSSMHGIPESIKSQGKEL